MGKVKEINIKSAYYYLDGMVNIEDFQSNLLEIDKKPHKDIDIYYIGYVRLNESSDYYNISNVNSLYLKIHSATGHFKEKNGEKYLIIDSTDKYEEIFSGIKSEIETLNGGKELYYEKNYARTGIITDDDLPLNKPLKFPTLTIIIRCVFQEGKKLHPRIYLEECLYKL